jgi:hypothetical protein
MRAYSDLQSISAYNGIYCEPYDFLSHPIAPCGTLIVLHNTRRETWGNFDLIGFYLGPFLAHYRSYHCLISNTDSYRVSDNIILYPVPLVLPDASRFDQLLALTERLTLVAETHSIEDQAQLSLCANSITEFLTADTTTQDSPSARLANPTPQSSLVSLTPPPATNFTSLPTTPVTHSTRHRPTSDTGVDLMG